MTDKRSQSPTAAGGKTLAVRLRIQQTIDKMNKKYADCDRCGKAINYGNACVSITRNVEQPEFNIAANREEIQIIDSEEILVLCGSCGNLFDAATINTIIRAIPSDNDQIRNN